MALIASMPGIEDTYFPAAVNAATRAAAGLKSKSSWKENECRTLDQIAMLG